MKEPTEFWKIQFPNGEYSTQTWHSEKKLSTHLMNNPRCYVEYEDSKSDAVKFTAEESLRVSVMDVLKDALDRKGERKSSSERRIAQQLVRQKERELEEAKGRLRSVSQA